MSTAGRESEAGGKWLGADKKHTQRCRARWSERRNRKQMPSGDCDPWAFRQCGACRYWIPVAGLLTETFGVCSNPVSPFDRTARFVHDGCNQFAAQQAAQMARDQ